MQLNNANFMFMFPKSIFLNPCANLRITQLQSSKAITVAAVAAAAVFVVHFVFNCIPFLENVILNQLYIVYALCSVRQLHGSSHTLPLIMIAVS